MWKPIKDAPRDGTKIMGQDATRKMVTWFGKASHIPMYGWCVGDDPEDIDLWTPTVWEKIK